MPLEDTLVFLVSCTNLDNVIGQGHFLDVVQLGG